MFKNGISGPFGPHNTSTAPLYAMALYSHFPFAFQFTESGVHSTLTTTHKPSPSPSQLVLWVNRSSTHTTQHSTHKFTAFPFINKVVSYLPFIMVTKDKHRQQQKKKTNEKKAYLSRIFFCSWREHNLCFIKIAFYSLQFAINIFSGRLLNNKHSFVPLDYIAIAIYSFRILCALLCVRFS